MKSVADIRSQSISNIRVIMLCSVVHAYSVSSADKGYLLIYICAYRFAERVKMFGFCQVVVSVLFLRLFSERSVLKEEALKS